MKKASALALFAALLLPAALPAAPKAATPPASAQAAKAKGVWIEVRSPEEFGPFLLGEPDVRQVFMQHHKDLLTPEFWQGKKERLLQGLYDDFYPYPQSARFTPDKLAKGLVDRTDV